MYSESDLESAVAAGVLSPQEVDALRTHVSAQRASSMVDEEDFRLLSGFNDIFVAIAGVLLLVGGGWLGGEIHPAIGAAAIAGLSWGLAEYFTRQKRMALPSIVFLLAFVGGVFSALVAAILGDGGLEAGDSASAAIVASCAAMAGGAAWLHWRRFQVPITIAAGAVALVGVSLSLLLAAVGDENIERVVYAALFALGLGVFAFAMRWDMSDPMRKTRRSDVAFWLHLVAAPMIAHSIFAMLGMLEGEPSVSKAIIVVALYVAMGLIALAVDRRALLVSALGYVIYAIIALFREFGAISLNVALAAFVIGSALLMLSAFWHSVRQAVLAMLPKAVGAKLPPSLVVPVRVQPAS